MIALGALLLPAGAGHLARVAAASAGPVSLDRVAVSELTHG